MKFKQWLKELDSPTKEFEYTKFIHDTWENFLNDIKRSRARGFTDENGKKIAVDQAYKLFAKKERFFVTI